MRLAVRCKARQTPEAILTLLCFALLVAGYAKPLALWELAGQLAELLGMSVELLDLRAASTVMHYQVITSGQCLRSAGVQTGLFECSTCL